MILAAASNPFIQSPGGAKFAIGFLGLFHTAVASLAIGFAFIVTVLQIIGYRRKDIRYDNLAKRVQLWHVCIYNIGTINAIGLVFALSGLFPQFWSQIFTQFFWTLVCEELLFFMLATTLTFHYFFWDTMWGHKKLHIFMGAMLTPMFFLQFYIINGMGAFMLTPGFGKDQVSLWSGTVGLLGWDKLAFYNPSFLMLTLHRTAANFAYGAFFVAAICGLSLYRSRSGKAQQWNETGGRLAFGAGFMSFLTLPVIGFFYAWVLKYYARGAYDNLMVGMGDVVVGGVDLWWTKQVIVAAMIGMGLVFAYRSAKARREFSLPLALVYSVGLIYLLFYVGMGMQMTWMFFWGSLTAAVLAGLWARHLFNRYEGSGRAVFVTMGLLSFLTVCLGGYVREASRPRFTDPSGQRVAGFNRIPKYADIYADAERPEQLDIQMVVERPDYVSELSPERPRLTDEQVTGADLASSRCITCHTLERIHVYEHSDWDRVVGRMIAYGARLTPEESSKVVRYLESGADQQAEGQTQDE